MRMIRRRMLIRLVLGKGVRCILMQRLRWLVIPRAAKGRPRHYHRQQRRNHPFLHACNLPPSTFSRLSHFRACRPTSIKRTNPRSNTPRPQPGNPAILSRFPSGAAVMMHMAVVVVRVVTTVVSPGSERRSGNHQKKQCCRKYRLHAFESSTGAASLAQAISQDVLRKARPTALD